MFTMASDSSTFIGIISKKRLGEKSLDLLKLGIKFASNAKRIR
jgi:hypothetical protein